MTEEKRLSLGINVSILLILMIFGVLLSLPLRLLFNTSYSDRSAGDAEQAEGGRESAIAMDHRRLRRCPNLEYETRLMSVFLDDYDGNCTYAQNDDDDDDDDDDGNDDGSNDDDDSDNDCKDKEDRGVQKEKIGRSRKGSSIQGRLKEDAEEILKSRQMKSVNVAGHILVAMLLVSVIAAFVEVLRIRFAREKVLRQVLRKLLSSLASEFSILGYCWESFLENVHLPESVVRCSKIRRDCRIQLEQRTGTRNKLIVASSAQDDASL